MKTVLTTGATKSTAYAFRSRVLCIIYSDGVMLHVVSIVPKPGSVAKPSSCATSEAKAMKSIKNMTKVIHANLFFCAFNVFVSEASTADSAIQNPNWNALLAKTRRKRPSYLRQLVFKTMIGVKILQYTH
eukprot:2461603-Amphidinium_carterae.1